MLAIDRLRWLYRAWRYRYRLETGEIRLVLESLAPGDVAVDVGAHKGAYTWWMSRAVGEGGKVYAFEPQPALADLLRRLTSNNRYRNVVIENQGLSSAAGEMTLHVPLGGPSPGASLEPRAESTDTYRVTVTTLDDYFAGREPCRVRLIKCDAEGHELEVFRGAEQLLAEQRPALLFECEARHRAGQGVTEVFDWLIAREYRGAFVSGGRLEDIERFDPMRDQAEQGSAAYVNNFFFQPREG